MGENYLQGEEDISCFEKQGFRSIPEFLEASFLSFKVLNRGLKKYFALFE
jgi:hypothetical protein